MDDQLAALRSGLSAEGAARLASELVAQPHVLAALLQALASPAHAVRLRARRHY